MDRLTIEGVVTVVQESRFWLRRDDGTACLLTARGSAPAVGDRVRVEVTGDLDARAVATRIERCRPE